MSVKIKTLLIDCDNTLVKSEKLAFAACCSLLNEVLAAKGVKRRFTPKQLMQEYVGRTFRAMLLDLSSKHAFPLAADELELFVCMELDRVVESLAANVRPCAGANKVLPGLSNRYRLAVVSSSALRRVHACLDRVGQDRFFRREHVYSAADSLPQPKSKPLPDVYLHALADLNQLEPTAAATSVALEDSPSGVKAAVAADILCLGYVGSHPKSEQEEAARQLHAVGAAYVIYHWERLPGVLRGLENGRLLVTPRSARSAMQPCAG